ncbi:hypothetical protein ACJIZ3_006804 [Penstemon smallii]|uniref:Knottins-like domain-containing protein n=1 Tax=Penstemon smallii TaxID=265156 RepID=A0ABD3S8P7_9LAMI
MNTKQFSGLLMLLLVIILASENNNNLVMGRTCKSPSFTFRGPCFSDHNCKGVCMNEGFDDGDCQGLLRRCYCKKPCADRTGPN